MSCLLNPHPPTTNGRMLSIFHMTTIRFDESLVGTPVVRSELASVGPAVRDIGFTMKHFPSVRLDHHNALQNQIGNDLVGKLVL
jgi:hypothetical protein